MAANSESTEFTRSLMQQLANPEYEDACCDLHGPYKTGITYLKGAKQCSPCLACFEIKRAEEDVQRIVEQAEEAKAIRQRAGQKRIEEKTGAAMIPRSFKGKKFEHYTVENEGQKRALSICQDYAHNFQDNLAAGRCLILCGKPGTGKTHLAAAIADHLVSSTEHTVVFRSLFSILQSVKNTYGSGSETTEADVFHALVTPDLLIIDEIGATKSTEFEVSTLFALINARYEDQLPTIIISNLEAKDLKDSIGDRCVDRLREGGGRALRFDWDSMRSRVGDLI